ncbi:MAG: sugar transferase [Candidatus Omnitrophica bacterium]|nr:sugar transferase [Candidatus Omnitrophota bacterium]
MLKERISFFRKLEMLTDVLLATAAFYWWYPFTGGTYLLPGFLFVWCGLLYFLGVYESFRVKQSSDILITVWSAACIGIGIFSSAAYLLKMQDLSRLFVLFIFFTAAALTSLEKLGFMFFFRHIRKKGYNTRNILVVGTGPRAQRFMDMVRKRGEWGLRIIGLIDEDPSLVGKEFNGFPVMGTLADVPDVVHENVVDEIVFIVPRSWFQKVEKVISFCETEGIRADIAIDVFDLKYAKAKQTELEDFLLLTFERAPMREWQLFLKGLFDVAFSGALLIVLSPVFLAAAAAVRLTSKGPVFYAQTRCGLKGRKFQLYKFRTMVENAGELLPALRENNEMTGPVFKIKNDPRITPLGGFLRKFSIDELPQLWNVFKRDMSIVGPRPPIPDEVKQYDNWQRRRLSMRPGITCLWQVQGRNTINDFDEWARLDLQYIDHWSLAGDAQILARTVPAVLFGVGAR